MKTTTKKRLRAVGYSRTSGEGQRDNTSIPEQRRAVEAFCEREGWELLETYADECRSGAKTAGREDFLRLMRDAAADRFDVVVCYQISRWGRDGADIIESSRTLKRDFGVDVVETAGSFDTRDRTNALMNFVGAGVAEHERLTILQRTMSGRMAKARQGLPWCGKPPAGRAFDAERGMWYLTEYGRQIAAALRRYADGTPTKTLAEELGRPHFKSLLPRWVSEGTLEAPYRVHFQSADIGLDEWVEVPGMPPVADADLMEKVRDRLAHNRRCTRTDARLYRLGGYIWCGECRKALNGQTTTKNPRRPLMYYRHYSPECSFNSVRGEALEDAVLDFLFGMFVDPDAFREAVRAALPSDEDREAKEAEKTKADKTLRHVDKQIANLVDAIAGGADVGILLEKQDQLKAEKARAEKTLRQAEDELSRFPTLAESEEQAALVRLQLASEHLDRDWRDLPPEEIQRFLAFLFGADPARAGTGIFVTKDADGTAHAEFRGRIKVPARVAVVDGRGRVVSDALASEARRMSRAIKRELGEATGLSGNDSYL
jgi:site-specific DNA recombinase